LIKAAKEGNSKKIIKLLNKLREPEKIADINYCDKNGYTALHTAAKFNQYDSMRLILITGDADINMPTSDGQYQTPLHIATIEQHFLLVKLLLQEFNADVNCQDTRFNTPLHYGINTGNVRLVKIILEKQPRLNTVNNDGFTPL
jgi:ankyrin repeat protein